MDEADRFASHPSSHWERRYFARGQEYRVIKIFTDANGRKSAVGERWTFIGSSFSRFEDEYTLCVRLAPGHVAFIALVDRPDGQKDVLAHPRDYFRSETGSGTDSTGDPSRAD